MPAAALAMTLAAAAAAAPPAPLPGQREGDYTLPSFRFSTGETLENLRLHYLVLGAPHRDAKGQIDNAALLLHGTTSTSKAFLQPSMAGELFGPGQPLDLARWYVVIPDGLGRGGSSKPSDGLRGAFPHYGYGDVVEAQHRLVTEGLGITHLRLVLGTSMGGMHAWMWAERWPLAMDAVMPIACQPAQISGRNLLFRRVITEAIRSDPGFHGGQYQDPPRGWLHAVPVFGFMTDSPVRLQAQGPTRKEAEALYDKLVEGARALDANDYLRWLESSADYDPEPLLGTIEARVLAVNFADDALNPVELGVLERLVPKVPRGQFVVVPAFAGGAGHQTLALAAAWKGHLARLLEGK
jgi:homoserine O-acetyltransferase/O-succinyltransferase